MFYPAWYVRRWHFLPDGYLSRWCAAAYDRLVRPLYNQGIESKIIRAVAGELARVRPNSVIEVGCGPGRQLEALAKRMIAPYLVGIDLSPYLLNRAAGRTDASDVRLVHANGLGLPSEDQAFDAAVASHYIGHLPVSLRADAVHEMVRIVRPGGLVVVVDHRWHSWPEHPGLLQVATRRFGLVRLTAFKRVALPDRLL